MEELRIPALFEHCLTVYAAMEEQGSLGPIRSMDNQEGLVYEGFLTHLITEEAHLSLPYYTKVTGKLKAMGCIQQLRRGGSSSPSRWLLHHQPTMELYDETDDAPGKKQRTDRLDTLEQQLRDINDRLLAAGL